jgi:hypothetical protein
MKKLLFVLTMFTLFACVSFDSPPGKPAETATITSVTHTSAGDVVCWNFTADSNVNGVYMEVKSKETNNVFKTTVGTDGQNSLAHSQTASGCNTYPFKGAKGRTYRIRVVRSSLTSYYSNEVAL